MILVEDSADAEQVAVPENDKLVWLSQTTLSVDETLATVGALKERFPHLVSPPSDDICYATQNRQAAVKAIAEQCDVMIVVGSGNSSNSVRLVEVALEAGAASAYRVDSAAELDEAWFENCQTVGLTSGASVPEILVDDVLDVAARAWLRPGRGGAHGRGDADVRAAARTAPRHQGEGGRGPGVRPDRVAARGQPRRRRTRTITRAAAVAPMIQIQLSARVKNATTARFSREPSAEPMNSWPAVSAATRKATGGTMIATVSSSRRTVSAA